MNSSNRIVIALAPFVCSVLVLFSAINPNLEESSRLTEQLTLKEHENAILEKKLAARRKLEDEKARLNKEIEQLRTQVPLTPDLDILVYDMHRISKSTGTRLLGIEEPESKRGAKKGLMEKLVKEVGGKIPGKQHPARRRQRRNQKPEPDPLGLMHLTKRVFVTGSYTDLLSFLRSMERYKRVVGINEVIVALPDDESREVDKTVASEKGKALHLDQPVMSFLMNVYYLPEGKPAQ